MSEEGSAKGRKRKRSIQDVPINMNKMRKMLETFKTLKDELYDIDETEIELGSVKQHLDSLETILRGAKKPKLNFSSLTLKDLTEIGVGDGLLDIDLEVISGRVSAKMQEPMFQAACTDLSREMVDIYTHVNMQYEAGARMILDAVFKALWKLQEVPKTLDHEGITVSLIPEFKLPKEGVKITNGEYEVWLSGSVDYCVTRYLATERNMELVLKLNSNTTESRLRIALNLTDHQLFLVEAKHAGRTSLEDYVPKAVGQALALCTFLRHDVM
ncbi:hypothetical protein QCA50_011235 [Cerrena zonata]|uniref:Uncharacterized protein n=1 Tax=Cerrena zonata TaxID=2478898 RepID=A0AAW0FUV2_9APHY